MAVHPKNNKQNWIQWVSFYVKVKWFVMSVPW